jgi:hypothetical protein
MLLLRFLLQLVPVMQTISLFFLMLVLLVPSNIPVALAGCLLMSPPASYAVLTFGAEIQSLFSH